jgi:hypothetical protein
MIEGETDEQRRVRLKGRGWVGVDLDGTLAEWHGWKVSGGKIGAPIPAMVARVKAWLQDGIEVRIFTARAALHGTHATVADLEAQRVAIDVWCFEHIGRTLTTTNVKDPDMIELWDDRAVQVVRNTGARADGQPG